MKKTIKVQLHSNGSENENLTRMIANYNSGRETISPRDIEGYFNTKSCIWAILPNRLKLIKDDQEPNTYHVSEDGGKTYTMTLEFCEVYEIEPEISNGKIIDPELINL